jgi:predicted RNA-binding protein YlxR (DUF448 family)
MAKRPIMTAAKKKRFEPEPILEFQEPPSNLEGGSQRGDDGIPVRTCVLERARKEKPSLLRFVLSPLEEVVPDIYGKLPGRGVWVTARKSSVEEAVQRRAFQRAFRKPVSVHQDLAVQVENLLKRSALERLSIANKAGLVLVGYVKVGEALKRNEIIALVHADIAAPDGKTKLDRKFAASRAGKDHIPPKNCFTSPEISLAAGSANVIHAGFKEGGASREFLKALERFSGYCTGEGQSSSLCQGKE